MTSLAAHSRLALAAIASSTGCRFDGEREMMPSTSARAVWYSRLSVSSFVLACSASNRRVFSMAIMA